MIDPEQKRVQVEKYAKWGFMALICAISAPIAMMAVEGLIAWIIFGGVALIALQFAPIFAAWVANKKVQALIAVIEANPIETMLNLYSDKTVEFNKQADAIRDFDTEFGNVSDLVDDLQKTDPTEAIQYAEMRDKMEQGLTDLKLEQTSAQGELDKFKTNIDKARRIYKVALAMNKALERSQSAQAKVFADIKEQVSFDKVRSDLNRAFANLNSAVDRRKNANLFASAAAKSLPPAVEVIDITQPRVLTSVKR